MRKAFLVVVGVGIAAVTLTGCAPASPGVGAGTSGGGSGSSAAPGGSGSSGGAAASLRSGKIAMCSVFSDTALSSASGKTFTETLATDSGDGVYGCAYNSSSGDWDWIVDVQRSTDGTVDNYALDLGGPSATHKVDGTGYPTVASKAGVSLVVGKDIVEVYTPSSAPDAQATTDQFVKVAKAAIAALTK